MLKSIPSARVHGVFKTFKALSHASKKLISLHLMLFRFPRIQRKTCIIVSYSSFMTSQSLPCIKQKSLAEIKSVDRQIIFYDLKEYEYITMETSNEVTIKVKIMLDILYKYIDFKSK